MTAKPTTKATKPTTNLPQRSILEELPLSKLVPSSFNPRTKFDEEALTELAASIREQGVLEPILVRSITLKSEYFEIVAGERRFRAAKLAGLETIPCLIRDLDDTQARLIAVTENLQRSDLDALDTARGYQILKEGGMAQADIAQKLGVSAGEISKSLSLLQLPQSAQEQLRTGELSAGQARAILGAFGKFPLTLPVVASYVIEEEVSVRDIEVVAKGNNGYGDLATALVTADVARGLTAGQCAFDRGVCNSCEHKAKVKIGYYEYCLLPAEFDKRNAEAKERLEAEALKIAQRLQAASSAGKASTTGDSAGASTPQFINLKEVPYDSYETLDSNRPKSCSDACPCIAAALGRYDNKPCKVCTNPKRYKSLALAETKASNKEKRSQADTDKAEVLAWKLAPAGSYQHTTYAEREPSYSVNSRLTCLAAARLAQHTLYSYSVDSRRAVAKSLPAQEYSALVTFLGTEGNKADGALGPLAWWLETGLPEDLDQDMEDRKDLLTMCCLQVYALEKIARHLRWGNYSTPEVADHLLERTPLAGYLEAKKRASKESAL